MIYLRIEDYKSDIELMPFTPFWDLVKYSQKKGTFENFWGIASYEGMEYTNDDVALVLDDLQRLLDIAIKDKDREQVGPIMHIIERITQADPDEEPAELIE